MFFFVKQKTAYEMRISDWSSDVCSSDLENIYKSQAERVLIAVVTTKGDRFCLHSEQSPKFELHRFKLGSLVKSLDKVTDTQSTATVPTRLQSPPIPQEERSAAFPNRSEESRVGKECVSTFRSRCTPYS